MFLYADMVGWSGERFPPLDDIYKNNKLNIPRKVQNGFSFFKSVATAWLTLLGLTYWHLLKSSDYHQKKKTLERLGLVWGIPDIPMTRLEITLTSTDGNRVCTPDKVPSCLIFPPHLISTLTWDGRRTGVVITMLHMSKQTWADEGLMLGSAAITSRAQHRPCGNDSERHAFPTISCYSPPGPRPQRKLLHCWVKNQWDYLVSVTPVHHLFLSPHCWLQRHILMILFGGTTGRAGAGNHGKAGSKNSRTESDAWKISTKNKREKKVP